MTFVDSAVWIDWLRGTPTAGADLLDRLIDQEELIVGDLVLVEVLQGIVDARQLERTRSRLLEQRIVTVGGVEIAQLAANNHRHLRRFGITPRGTIDTLIATRCIHEGWPLLSSDRDFMPFAERLGLELLVA